MDLLVLFGVALVSPDRASKIVRALWRSFGGGTQQYAAQWRAAGSPQQPRTRGFCRV